MTTTRQPGQMHSPVPGWVTRSLIALMLLTPFFAVPSSARGDDFTPLTAAGERVIERMQRQPQDLTGYRRDLAYEAILRWDEQSGKDRGTTWVLEQLANSNFRPDSAAAKRRGPFNCLIFWVFRSTEDEAWLPAFVSQTTQYLENVPRSPEGAILHPRSEARGGGQAMLIDALQDYSSRMAMLATVTGEASPQQEAVAQFRIYRDIVRDPQTGLWHQGRGWNDDPMALSPGFWSRGHGWLIRGMVDTLLLLPKDSPESQELQQYLEELADALVKVQQPSGMWHCLLNRSPDKSPPEVSGTALIAANFAMALDAGFLYDDRYREAARRAFQALPDYVDEQGLIHSVSPGPGPLSTEAPWITDSFPPGNDHGPFTILFAAMAAEQLAD